MDIDSIAMIDELKPCPFCGGEAKTEVAYITCGGDDLLLRATVFCSSCGVSRTVKFNAMRVPFDKYVGQFKAAADMWNRRAE